MFSKENILREMADVNVELTFLYDENLNKFRYA